jgi:hypothetical protein
MSLGTKRRLATADDLGDVVRAEPFDSIELRIELLFGEEPA